MKAFLDTSSLLKLYHQESDTETLSNALAEMEIIYLSELAQLEFCSAIWKKVRTQEIDSEIAKAVISCFEEDAAKVGLPLFGNPTNNAHEYDGECC
jgi:predicted nucleic acid-binding protein